MPSTLIKDMFTLNTHNLISTNSTFQAAFSTGTFGCEHSSITQVMLNSVVANSSGLIYSKIFN